MKQVANLIIENIPDYKHIAALGFERNFYLQWYNPKYEGYEAYEILRRKYRCRNLTRQNIINLFVQRKNYDGFLCAMVWGNIGSYNTECIKSVFSTDIEIHYKINRIVAMLNKGDRINGDSIIKSAYISLCGDGENKIKYVGESFFTKLLYFAGANINNLYPKPLILDKNMTIVYNELLKPNVDYNVHDPNDCASRYIDYCLKMEKLGELLDLKSGYVEALLFYPRIRKLLISLTK